MRTLSSARADRDALGSLHPAVSFAFFAAVVGITMFSLHPVVLAASLIGSLLYRMHLDRTGAAGLAGLVLTAFALPAVINPLFNHAGVTVLGHLPSGNPVTLESIVYGAATGAMLAATMVWFSCVQRVMTSDKIIYLFGRLWPALALVFSMVLRFVPRFRTQLGRIEAAQRGIGRDPGHGSARARAHAGMRMMSILGTWALESSVETADSMRSRGYGLRGRTSFSLFRVSPADRVLAPVIALSVLPVAAGAVTGDFSFLFLPGIAAPPPSALGLAASVSFTFLCLLPVLLDWLDDLKWRSLRSKI